jgi:polysaccharide export outer membrane protein
VSSHAQSRLAALLAGVLLANGAASAAAAQAKPPARNASPSNAAPAIPAAAPVPTDYVIGPDDVLTVIFWREKDLSGDVAVRPDGRISLPLLNEVDAAGLTPEQLRVKLTEKAGDLLEDPNVTVVVKAINSRRVFITGQVAKPGPYPLMGPLTIAQLITVAGGVQEYADAKNITILRTEKGRSLSFRFNYDEVKRGKKLQQNIELKPGDTVIVP